MKNSQKAGRVGDRSLSYADGGAKVDVGVSGSSNILINNKPALRVGDTSVSEDNQERSFAVSGAPAVLMNDRRAHRLNDLSDNGSLVGNRVTASSNVDIGNYTTAESEKVSDGYIVVEIDREPLRLVRPPNEEKKAIRSYIKDKNVFANNRGFSQIDPYWHFEHESEELYDTHALRLIGVRIRGIAVDKFDSYDMVLLLLDVWDEGDVFSRIFSRPEYRPTWFYKDYIRKEEQSEPVCVFFDFNGKDHRNPSSLNDVHKWNGWPTHDRYLDIWLRNGEHLHGINLTHLMPGDYRLTARYRSRPDTTEEVSTTILFKISRAPIYRYQRALFEVTRENSTENPVTAMFYSKPLEISKMKEMVNSITNTLLRDVIPLELSFLAKTPAISAATSLSNSPVQNWVQTSQLDHDMSELITPDMTDSNKKVREEDVNQRYSQDSVDKWPAWYDSAYWKQRKQWRVVVHGWQMEAYSFSSEKKSYRFQKILSVVTATFGALSDSGEFIPRVTRWRIIRDDLLLSLWTSVKEKGDVKHVAEQILGRAFYDPPGLLSIAYYESDFDTWLAPYVYEQEPVPDQILREFDHYPSYVPKGGTGLKFPKLSGLPSQPNPAGVHRP